MLICDGHGGYMHAGVAGSSHAVSENLLTHQDTYVETGKVANSELTNDPRL